MYVNYLLKRSLTLLHKTDEYGGTALHKAAENGHLEVCKLLIQKAPNLITQKPMLPLGKVAHTALHKAA